MGSMNWLGFSLCPQGLPSQGSNHGGLSTDTEECYELGSDSTVPSSFGFLEAFHRSTDNQSQDWNMKGNSEISMLMGNQEVQDEQPKLENFLGSSHSFKENNSHNNNHPQNNGVNYMLLNDYNNINNHTHNNNNNNNGVENPNSTNNGLNVSMINTWLKSNNNPSQEMVTMSEDTTNNNGANGGGSGGAQSLSLSMGTGPHSGVAALPLLGTGNDDGNGADMDSSLCENSSSSSKQQSDIVSSTTNTNTNTNATNLDTQSGALESVPRKSIETFGQRTSIYRGVTRHRWTGRYEAHLWDNSCRREGQTRKGRQVYLGGYDKEEKAARAYDLAAIKYWGTTTTTNFPISDYEKEVEDMQHMTRQEYVASLRRKSSGFSRGASIYRGVTRHHQHGRWQARIGRVAGNKDLYLGTFSTQEEAAEAYDIAAIKFRGLNAVTNFEINRYDVKSILESTNLPIGGAAKRLKEVEDFNSTDSNNNAQILRSAITATEIGIPNYNSWPGIAFQQAHPVTMQTMQYHPYGNNAGQLQERVWCKQEQDPEPIGSNHYSDLSQQVQMGHGTHNFFQMDNNVMGSGSDSGGYGLPYGNGNENYYSFLSQQANNSNSNSSNDIVRGAVGYYDQGSTCTNWVPTAIPTIASRTANVAVVGGPTGVPPFTMWNNA